MTYFALSKCGMRISLIFIVFSVFSPVSGVPRWALDETIKKICGKKLFINLAVCATSCFEIARLNLT
jgi:hypothetical protein